MLPFYQIQIGLTVATMLAAAILACIFVPRLWSPLDPALDRRDALADAGALGREVLRAVSGTVAGALGKRALGGVALSPVAAASAGIDSRRWWGYHTRPQL